MAILTNVGITATVRSMIGDDTAGNYLASDTQFLNFIKTATLKLPRYYTTKAEDTTVTGDSGYDYTIPSTIVPEQVTDIFLRTGTDVSTDQPIYQNVRRNGSTIILPYTIDSNTHIVFWYKKAYSIGTDDVPDFVAEILYKLVIIEWYIFAIHKRADFEQWAATNRSDVRISELRQALAELKTELKEFADEVNNGAEIADIWGGV